MGLLDDLLSGHVVQASPDETVQSIATLMQEKNVGSVVIVEGDTPVGIVTDRDLALSVVMNDQDAETVLVKSVMNPDPITVERDSDILEILRTMIDHGVRRLPVVEQGDLIGIVALDDLVCLLADQLTSLGRVIESEMPDTSPRPE